MAKEANAPLESSEQLGVVDPLDPVNGDPWAQLSDHTLGEGSPPVVEDRSDVNRLLDRWQGRPARASGADKCARYPSVRRAFDEPGRMCQQPQSHGGEAAKVLGPRNRVEFHCHWTGSFQSAVKGQPNRPGAARRTSPWSPAKG